MPWNANAVEQRLDRLRERAQHSAKEHRNAVRRGFKEDASQIEVAHHEAEIAVYDHLLEGFFYNSQEALLAALHELLDPKRQPNAQSASFRNIIENLIKEFSTVSDL